MFIYIIILYLNILLHYTGVWKLEVKLDADSDTEEGLLTDFSLVLHGTKTSPYLNQEGESGNMKLQVAKRLHSLVSK